MQLSGPINFSVRRCEAGRTMTTAGLVLNGGIGKDRLGARERTNERTNEWPFAPGFPATIPANQPLHGQQRE